MQSALGALTAAPDMVTARQAEIRRLRVLLKRATFVVALKDSGVLLSPCVLPEVGVLLFASRAHQRITRLLVTCHMLSRRNRIPRFTD